ncbi:MAG: hypothetical protein M5R40_03665 [Anaerolineae bacterium]|nr:hypothetical protein [Anaerolineae bacterium]
MDFITYLQERLLRELPEVVKAYPGDLDAEDLSGMETAVRQMVHELGNAVLQAWLEAQDEPYPADTQPCACGEVANYVRKRRGMTLTCTGGCTTGGRITCARTAAAGTTRWTRA